MKIAFFSNFLNHHQLPLCKALSGCEDVKFTFVATEPIERERLAMGYADMNQEDFVLRAYDEGGEDRAMELAVSADVMIFGSAPTKYLTERMKANKLTFYFSERVLKKGAWRRFIPSTRKKLKAQFLDHKHKALYVLGASAYMARDMEILGFPTGRCLRWGYFPKITSKDVDALFEQKSATDVVEILYAGRLLELKRVIDALKALNVLLKKGVDNFRFTVIGDGEEASALKAYAQQNGMNGNVRFLPFVPSDEVRKVMDGADVYFFGSDFREGWGAVVNEAMNSACAVVASHAVGSSAFLIEDGVNGLVYECGNIADLAEKFERVVKDGAFRKELGREAYRTVTKVWNAEVAGARLVELARRILDQKGDVVLYEDGPCSPAPVLSNGWIRQVNRQELPL